MASLWNSAITKVKDYAWFTVRLAQWIHSGRTVSAYDKRLDRLPGWASIITRRYP